ncbi:MAG: hypothetical protein IKC59_08430 [Clostridia bacterium]|nr:hypothetical protein [Clostridia bacterium]MBR7099427.1 hypothetical protein [Clostridia bacterium]
MFAGFSEVDFTPSFGIMPGEFEPYFARGCHLPLLASACAFTDGGETVVMVSCDHLHFPNEDADTIRHNIAKETGLPLRSILIGATHTHTGPPLSVDCWYSHGDPLAASVVIKRVVQAAVNAVHNQKEGATFGIGITEEKRFSFCRDWILKDGTKRTNPGYGREDLDHPYTTPDYSVNVMRVEQDGKIAALIVNYANHPDNHRKEERTKFSPDYPGYMRRELKRIYGEDVTVLFFNGACGDVNDLDFKNETDHATYRRPDVCPPEEIGKGLAETVSALVDTISATESKMTIRAVSSYITVNHRQITLEEIAWATDVLNRAKEDFSKNASELATASVYLTKIAKGIPAMVDIECMIWQLGSWAIVALPGEIYTELGRTLKEKSPFENTLVFELVNGSIGYVIPDCVRGDGSYEGRFSSGITGYGTIDAITNTSMDVLNQWSK